MKSRRFFSVIFLMAAMQYTSLAQDNAEKYSSLSLQQCIDIAIQNNTDVQTRKLNQESAEVGLQTSKGNMLPTVNAGITHGTNHGRSIDPFTNTYINQNVSFANYNLSSGVVLFNGFSIQDDIKSNKLAVQASHEETQQVKDNLALNVILAYLTVLTNQDLLSQAEKQKAVTEKQVNRLETLNANGAVNPSQLYDLKGQLAADELSIVNTRNNLNSSILTLTQLMNIPYSNSISFERVTVPEAIIRKEVPADSIYQMAAANLAVLKAAELRKQSADFAVKANRASRFPSISLNGGLFTNYSSVASSLNYVNTTEVETGNYVVIDGNEVPVLTKQDNYSSSKLSYGDQFKNNFNTSVSIGINIPLLNGLQTKARIRNAQIQQKQATINAEAARITLQQNTSQAAMNMQASADRFEVLQKQKDAFTQSFDVASTRLESGVINTVEYLIAKNNLDRASSNLIISQYDYILRAMMLDYYTGVLSFK